LIKKKEERKEAEGEKLLANTLEDAKARFG
jgi:hypothetical protein